MRKISFTLILVCLGFAVSTARASYVWIEQPEERSAMVHFGEFGENQRAKSPGLLDRFGKPAAVLLSDKEEKTLQVTRSATSLTLSGKAAAGENLIVEDPAFLLRKLGRGGQETMLWLWPGARYITNFSAQAPRLTLDITPTGKMGEFRVTLKNKPLQGAKVRIVVQSKGAEAFPPTMPHPQPSLPAGAWGRESGRGRTQ